MYNEQEACTIKLKSDMPFALIEQKGRMFQSNKADKQDIFRNIENEAISLRATIGQSPLAASFYTYHGGNKVPIFATYSVRQSCLSDTASFWGDW